MKGKAGTAGCDDDITGTRPQVRHSIYPGLKDMDKGDNLGGYTLQWA
jgi:hypothetical protein